MSRRYRQHSDRQLSLEAKAAKLSASMQAGAAVVGGVAYFVNLGFGSYLVAAGSLSVGSLLAFISLMHYLVYPFMDFASSWSSFQRSVSAFERVWEILGNPSELNVMPAPFRSSLPSLSVELQDVSFSYDGETMVLKHLNLVIPAGKTVAIVGPSGAGKSTLFKLLLGLYQPSSGNILFDKKCVHQYSVTEFRSFIAYVPQETYLFDGTIRENLLYGYIHATEPELIKAAKDANIHEFIMSLPDQYNAKIGERGIRLSGGQKQRLSIARALLKNAPLLLLDEATSFLDNENELAVQASLAKLMSGRTTIVIAHRLSTIQNADWIIFLDKGTVVAEGTHDMLIKPDTPYSKMYNLEFRQHELSLIK
jgi:subfamily B ATP-binding cassette protein MsbA